MDRTKIEKMSGTNLFAELIPRYITADFECRSTNCSDVRTVIPALYRGASVDMLAGQFVRCLSIHNARRSTSISNIGSTRCVRWIIEYQHCKGIK
jgi:hypothetical protein